MKNCIISNKPVSIAGEIVQYKRSDGFTVFLDGDIELDRIRLNAEIETVIKAVAIRRCQQIARNYAMKYAPDKLAQFEIKELKKIELKKEYV